MPYRDVRALARGLDILAAMNNQPAVTASLVSRITGIHRTTTHRLLETLRQHGFVYWSDSDETYRLSRRVKTLSDGYDDDARLLEGASRVLPDLLKRVQWPSDFTTLDGCEMIVRESSHQRSPHSFYRRQVGSRWPLLGTAIGRAYLAFSDRAERERLISQLSATRCRFGSELLNPDAMNLMVKRVRRNGYAESCREATEKVSAIAVPVFHPSGRVAACLNLIFFSSALQPSDAAREFLMPLQNAARRIEREAHSTAPRRRAHRPDTNLRKRSGVGKAIGNHH